MNINIYSFETKQSDPVWYNPPQSLPGLITRHAEVMTQTGFSIDPHPVDTAVLVSVGPEFQGAMEVWLATTSDTFVWVDTEGVVHERVHPTSEDL